MTFTMAFAIVVIITIATIIITAMTIVMIISIKLMLLVTRHIFLTVPTVLHKIYSFTARIIFVTMLFPVLCMPRRYAQVDRRAPYMNLLDNHRLRIEDSRLWIASNIKPTVIIGLSNIY